MNRLRCLLSLALALVLCGPAVSQAPKDKKKQQPYPEARPPLGTPAPDFTLRDLDGKEFRLKALQGRPVVIEFGSYT